MDRPIACPGIADFTDIAGPYVLGHLLSFAIFGVLAVQLYVYTVAFKNDPLWLRTLVYTIFSIEVAFQSIETYMAWWSLGAGWGQLSNLLGFPSPTIAFTTLTGLVTSLVHAFYSWRIAVLMRGYVVAGVIGLLSVVQLSMTVYITVHLAQNQGDAAAAALQLTSRIITVWFAFAAAADVIITVTMSALLSDARRRSHYVPTNTKLQNLVKYTVETGAVTTCAVLTDMILFLTVPHTNYHYMIFYSVGKIYANTLMATLNARITFVTSADQTATIRSNSDLRFRASENELGGSELWTNTQRSRSKFSGHGRGTNGDLRVNVAKTTLVLKDDHDEIEMSPGKTSSPSKPSGEMPSEHQRLSDSKLLQPPPRNV